MERLAKGGGLSDPTTGRVPSSLLLPGADKKLAQLGIEIGAIPTALQHSSHDHSIPAEHTKDHLHGGDMNPNQGLAEDYASKNPNAVISGFVTAPHYGGGHEGRDSKDHFRDGSLVNIDDSAPAQDVPVLGGEAVPHYGGGHEDMDTFEHMNMAMVPESGAETFDLATGSTQVPHYGHGHEDKDTIDHFKPGTLDAEIEADVFTHFGGESRATHEVSSLGAGMIPTKDDDAKYSKIFKKQKKIKPMGPPGSDPATLQRTFRNDRLSRIKRFKAIKGARSSKTLSPTNDAKSPPSKRIKAGSAKSPLPAIASPEKSKKFFLAVPTFEGGKPGYVFKMGKFGVGYYLDLSPEEVQKEIEAEVARLAIEAAALPPTKQAPPPPTAKSSRSDKPAAEFVKLAQQVPVSKVLDTFAHMKEGFVDADAAPAAANPQHKSNDTFAHIKDESLPATVKVVKTIAQKYGGDHENDDSFDHFESMAMNGTGERTKTDMFGNHYGGGHEDMDTFSHMAPQALKPTEDGSMTFSEMVDGHLGASDKRVKDHTNVGTLIPDIEEGNVMSGLIVAPHYGHGHEDKDTFEHMNMAMVPAEDGSKSKSEQYGNHYGGGHENADTYSHMNSDMVPRAEVPKKTAYGEEARNILMQKHLKPKKAKMVYGGTVQLTKHDLDTDTRYSDSSAKGRGGKFRKREKGTYPKSRSTEDDATIAEEDRLKTAPWFAQTLVGSPSPEPLGYPGYVRTVVTRERAVTGKPGARVSAV